MGDVLLLLYYYTLAKKFLNYQRLLSRLKHCRIFRDCFDSFYDKNTKISNYKYEIYLYFITYVKSKGYKLSVFIILLLVLFNLDEVSFLCEIFIVFID